MLHYCQVLAGDVEEAICHHAVYYSMWRKYGCLPERYNWQLEAPDVRFYPLRPELAESTYLLYRATRNPFYLHVGRDILQSLNNHTKAKYRNAISFVLILISSYFLDVVTLLFTMCTTRVLRTARRAFSSPRQSSTSTSCLTPITRSTRTKGDTSLAPKDTYFPWLVSKYFKTNIKRGECIITD